ncbi:MAG: class I SAM-dependent methyltransferase [Oscillospiraceae bacterium]
MASFWDKFARLYGIAESVNYKVYAKMLGYTVSLVPEGADVLDCAAGTGALSIAAAKNARHVLCTDMSEKMLDVAREKCTARDICNVSFGERDIFALPDNDGSYDIVIAANVLHLVDEPEAAVRELYRVVKPGGKLLLPCFTTRSPDGDTIPIVKLYKKFGFSPKTDFTAETYAEMLKNSGVCGRIRIKKIDGFIPCAYAVINKNV